MSDRSELRTVVFVLADNVCEHPAGEKHLVAFTGEVSVWRRRCWRLAVELAHLYPRGMGHTGYRDTPANVIAACEIHARSTDNLTHPAWTLDVPPPHDRRALTEWIFEDRERRGYTMLADWPNAWAPAYV